ncbi:RtcB family protein [Candidatus Parcubacteria bacterium]|nr:RtcB family protein [Candidatus Parcubacteria bacterium]
MKKIITSEKIPIKLWLADIEEGAMRQVKNIANHPYAFHHVAIMPDAHEGYGMPIGGVMAVKDAIIPNAVGVDIGCGVCAQKTLIKEIDADTIKSIMSEIRKVIPLGFNRHKTRQDENLMPALSNGMFCVNKEWDMACKSLGTLGGGNHFIEIQKSNEGYIWIMLHSGSRNLGKKVADYYNKSAIEHCRKKNQLELVKQELAYLPMDSDIGKSYFKEMNFCLDYALANRKLMMKRIKDIILNIIPSTKYEEFINIAHNYASKEFHFGEDVIVHRKGATKAEIGQLGIIPGSQGSKSYIVKGLGNKESYNSCSHGAGRKMGRKQAIRELDLEEEIKKLDEKGVIHSIRTKRDLDEASSAYKDIDMVMKNQEDLIEIIISLNPIAVVKG